MPNDTKLVDLYLDIETDWQQNTTILGYLCVSSGVAQMIHPHISTERLLSDLPENARLFTYNGHSFDLPCLKREFGIDFRERYTSIDLRWECQRKGIVGGQKVIEQQLGMIRPHPEISGRDAPRLWSNYQKGDANALRSLLEYNREDLYGLMLIKEYLQQRGWLSD